MESIWEVARPQYAVEEDQVDNRCDICLDCDGHEAEHQGDRDAMVEHHHMEYLASEPEAVPYCLLVLIDGYLSVLLSYMVILVRLEFVILNLRLVIL
jgi:hypothetical protein